LNGKVEKSKEKEYGFKKVTIAPNSTLLQGLEEQEQVWMSHTDHVTELSEDFQIIASSDTCKYASIENVKRKLYGIQFHGEVHHTTNGKIIFQNFVFKICQAKQDWKIDNVTERIIQELKEKIKDDSVIMGVSGGVDSTVAATLLHHAIGKNLHCVFIDNGLLRKDEREEVCEMFKQDLKMENFLCVDAKEEFLTGLKGITDPEEKRKIIGHTFIKIFEETIEQIFKTSNKEKIKYLGQGTIYPDRIESAEPTKQASKIKSHHNLTLPENMKLSVIEPLKEFYKDEVRKAGEILKVPKKLIMRHPCPGPALAIRILGEVTESRLKIVRESDKIFIDTLLEMNYYDKVWQAFAVLLPLKTVGVQGDARTYEFIISLR
jgi:GMP synthase (glutamine-hydrolysing)